MSGDCRRRCAGRQRIRFQRRGEAGPAVRWTACIRASETGWQLRHARLPCAHLSERGRPPWTLAV